MQGQAPDLHKTMQTKTSYGVHMTKSILYLLTPGFTGRKGRREYCPECAEIWGLLSYYPAIKETLDIRALPIDKPRAEMVELLGDSHQNCPTLVLMTDAPEGVRAQTANGHSFIDNARDIGLYFAAIYGTANPRGHY